MRPKNEKGDRDRSKTLKDVILFGRVLSTGLLIGGYVFLGVYASEWLSRNGYPLILVVLSPIAIALFGLWQGWLFIRQLGGKNAKK